MKEKKTFICVICPKGCKITIEKKEDGYTIEGNKCPRGKDYVMDEYTAPKRVITSTIKVSQGYFPVTAVKTSKGIPKKDIFRIMDIINHTQVQSPCKVGDVILRDIGKTGADLIVTREC
ncbi:MAG: DUF1667 domain-containing protein [Eubacteriales bacterium]